MTNFIKQFKSKANSKNLTSSDMVALCIYKTMCAKSENKEEILKYFLDKAFTPHSINRYGARKKAIKYLYSDLKPGKRWNANKGWYQTSGELLNIEISELLGDDEQAFRELLDLSLTL